MMIGGDLYFDTDINIVDQTTGEPMKSFSTIGLPGGPFVNGPIKFYEQNYVAEHVPVFFGTFTDDQGKLFYAFYDSSGNLSPGTAI